MKVYIDNQEIEIRRGSLSISNTVEEHDTCSFTVISAYPQYYDFEKGQTVEICEDSGKLLYSGYIYSVDERLTTAGKIEYNIKVQGQDYLASKRVFAKGYSDSYIGDIIEDIVNNVLIHEGVTIGKIDKGIKIKRITFNYKHINEIFDELKDLGNYMWFINQNKKLYFIEQGSLRAPYDLDISSIGRGIVVDNQIRITKSQHKYRNTQFITGCKGLTNKTVYKKGDGTTKEFDMGYPLAKQPRIYIDRNDGNGFVEQTIGVKGLTEGKQFYWQYNNNTIVQADGEAPLESNHILKAEIIGMYDLVIKTNDQDAIFKQQKKDRTTGIVENVEEGNYVGLDVAMEFARLNINKNKDDGVTIIFKTDRKGFEAGQEIRVNIPQSFIYNQYFKITAVDLIEDNGAIFYNIKCVKGPLDDSWVKFFQRKQSGSIDEVISSVETITLLFNFSKDWYGTENPNVFATTLYPSKSLFPSTSLYPSLNPKQKIKYLAWFKDGEEAGRVEITDESSSANEIITVGFIHAQYGGNISHIGWFGGSTATEELGTGYLLDIQPLDKHKEQYLEVYQIVKVDTKAY